MFGGKGLKFLQRAGAAKFCVPAAEPVAWIEVEGDVLGVIWNQSVGDGCCAIGAEDLRVARGGLDDAFGRGAWKDVDQTKGDEEQQTLNAAGDRNAHKMGEPSAAFAVLVFARRNASPEENEDWTGDNDPEYTNHNPMPDEPVRTEKVQEPRGGEYYNVTAEYCSRGANNARVPARLL